MAKNKQKTNIKNDANGKVFENVFKSIIKYSKWILLLAIILICFSGVYKVDTGEVAVVLRFGKLVGQTQEEQIKEPGLHIAFPYIIDEVVKIPLEKIQEQTISTHYESKNSISTDVKKTGYLLTGDANIVLINSTIKYKISNPIKYALYVNEVEKMIEGIVSAESTSLVAKMSIDDVLTTEKTEMADILKQNVQTCLNEVDCGIEVTNMELTSIVPPKEAESYFTNVNTAKIEKETMINLAKQYASSKIPEAESEAEELIEEAKLRQQEALIVTNAEMSEFYGLYAQYLENPESIENGVFRERISVVIAQSGAVVIVPEDGTPPIIILP